MKETRDVKRFEEAEFTTKELNTIERESENFKKYFKQRAVLVGIQPWISCNMAEMGVMWCLFEMFNLLYHLRVAYDSDLTCNVARFPSICLIYMKKASRANCIR